VRRNERLDFRQKFRIAAACLGQKGAPLGWLPIQGGVEQLVDLPGSSTSPLVLHLALRRARHKV
jgi:hypothetical protein